jgi:hypothetical protein
MPSSIPCSTYLSISLYLAANQRVAAKKAKKSLSAVGEREKSRSLRLGLRKSATRGDDKFELAGCGIGDFTKDSWVLGAGGGGDVAGALVERFVG